MRPKCLCFVFFSSKGIEHIRTFPEVIKKSTEKKIVLASFPNQPEANLFTTNMMGKLFICSYIFTITGKEHIKYAMLIAAYEKVLEKPDWIHNFFVRTIAKYNEDGKLTVMDIANELPDIYNNIRQTYLKTKVIERVTIEISTSEREKDEEIKDDVSDVINDIWVDDKEEIEDDMKENYLDTNIE